jgi:hypothetical protein
VCKDGQESKSSSLHLVGDHCGVQQWLLTRGPQVFFLNTQILNKIRADIEKLVKKKQCQLSH